jgi:hypothetical protein
MVVRKRFYIEHYLKTTVEVPKCVQEELSFGAFATEGCGHQLRAPRLDSASMKDAMRTIGNTLPVYYGEPAGMLVLAQIEPNY